MPKIKKAACSPRTAVAYARYSSAGQRDVSIEQQLRDIRAFADREGYTIVHEYADRAKSGFRHASARSQFQAMLSAAENGSFDTVIVWKVDRFSRNREEAALFKRQLRESGVSVVYAMEPIQKGAAGVLTGGMLEAIAEWYSVNLSENISRGMNDNARRCLYNGTKILGYHRGPDGHYAITKDEAGAVRSIFEQYADGFSAASIADQLNASGLRTPRGCRFSPQTILRILANERYVGVYIWGDIRVPGGMPAIISPELYERTKAMRQKTTRHVETSPADFLLTGKCFCGYCGEGMVGDSGTSKNGVTHYYYTCHGRKARKGCKKKSVKKEYLEDLIIHHIVTVCFSDPERNRIADAVMEAQRQEDASSPLAAMEAEYKDVKKKIDNINDAIESGIWNSSTSVRLKALEDTAEELRKSIETARFYKSQHVTREDVLQFLDEMSALDPEDPAMRKTLIHAFVNAVYLFDDHLRLVINCSDGNARIPLEDLPEKDLNELPPLGSCSDNDTNRPPDTPQSNTRLVSYRIPV